MRLSHARLAWFGALALAIPACGGSNGGGGDDGGDDAATVDGAPADAPPAGYVELIGRDWSLNAGDETYRCVRIKVDHDIWVHSFRAQAPLGTHHTVLTISNSASGPLGNYDCSAGGLDYQM